MTTLIIIIAIVVVLAVIVIGIYNRLVSLRNQVDTGWSQIDVQLQRRYDLIPNLINTVKGYAAHESQTFENVTAARAATTTAQGPAEQGAAENMLTGALRTVFAVAEAYPDLKANENFLALQEELTATEGRIAYARQFYNDSVNTYNTAIQQVPGNLIAGPTGFKTREFFEMEGGPETRQAPKVEF